MAPFASHSSSILHHPGVDTPDLQKKASPGLLVTIPTNIGPAFASQHDGSASELPPASAADTDESGSQSGGAAGEGSHSPEPDGDGQGKKRQRLKPEQTRRLMEVFEKTTKPDSEMRKALGKQLDMKPRTVQIWFQNRRAKLKRESNASDPLRVPGYFGTGMYANRGRLTYNRAYMNRRPVGRVVSEGYEGLRGIQGFEPYPHEPFRGLPLQNPSQISIPSDIPLQFTLQSLHGGSPLANNSAIGIPGGQGPSSAGMSAIGAPGGPPVPAVGHMFSPVIPTAATPHAGQQQQQQSPSPAGNFLPPRGYVHPVALQLQSPNGHDAARGRFRSFTADCHSLASVARAVHSQPLAESSDQQQQASQATHIHPPPADVPSAGALLESRRRHLQDMIIINQTHAARGITTSSLPTVHEASSSEAIDPNSTSKPLLFAELAQSSPLGTSNITASSISTSSITTTASSSSSPVDSVVASAAAAASSSAGGGAANSAITAASTPAPSFYIGTDAAAPAPNASSIQGYMNKADIGVKANGGGSGAGTCDTVVCANEGSSNDTIADAMSISAMPAHDQQLAGHSSQACIDQPAAPVLPFGCVDGEGTSGQYQLLNDLIMQCNAFDFLNGAQPEAHSSLGLDLTALDHQLGSSGDLSPEVLQQPASSTTSEAETLGFSQGLGDIPLTPSKLAESLLSGNAMLANAVAAAGYLNTNCDNNSSSSTTTTTTTTTSAAAAINPSGSTASANSSSSPSIPATSSQPEANASSVTSFLVAPIGSMATAAVPAASLHGSNHLNIHTSLPDLGMLQPKPTGSQVSVASSELLAQRDVMIEQMAYPTMPF
ncbi:hypothetical protein GGI12_001136 [Dipsacomyces acuminosporus]|nr:hypothetical protein GGI12_001136 [Dipsacomyces acuminosporus]